MTGIPDIATLADKQAITEVIRSYCRAVDRLDIPLGQSIFHDDGEADYGPFYTGPGKGVIEAICESHHQLTSHSHQVTNILIEVDGDSAGSESYVFGTMRSEQDGKVMQIGVWGRYLDKWEKRGGRWAIVQRKVVFDHDEIREVSPAGQEPRSTRDGSDPSYKFLTSRTFGEAIDV